MKKAMIIDIKVAIEELIENDIIEQFDEINADIINMIINKANELANEK